jgi:Na+/H+-dicarboxylate symporter
MASGTKRNWLQVYFGVTLWKRVLVGLALGVIAGLALRAALGPEAATELTTNWFRPFGDGFVRLIRMLVVPLVFTTLAAGVLAMGDPAKLGGIGVKAFALYIVTTLFAVVIGIGMGAILQPGSQADFADVVPSQVGADAPGIVQRLLAIIPDNPFGALASGDILAVIFFAILMGVTMLVMGETAKPVANVFTVGAEVM